MNIWKIFFFNITGLIVFLALATVSAWICSNGLFESGITYAVGVPFIYLFTPGLGLVWFSQQHLDVDRKWRRLVWVCLGLAFLLWLYTTVIFFFGTTIEIHQNGSH